MAPKNPIHSGTPDHSGVRPNDYPRDHASSKETMTENPLLQPWTGEYGLPPFAYVRAEHFAPAFEVMGWSQREGWWRWRAAPREAAAGSFRQRPGFRARPARCDRGRHG